ncbi:MAG: phosphoribosyltransferase [Candidatus Micrarchaeia archaeon]
MGSETFKRYLKIDCEQYNKHAEELAEKIKGLNKQIEGIVYIQRGGMTLARLLSDSLDIRKLYAVDARSYKDIGEQSELELKSVPKLTAGKTYLLVDDIFDTGNTLSKVKAAILKESKVELVTAVLIYKDKNLVKDKPDAYALECSSNTWVIFYYEMHETRESFLKSGNEEGLEALRRKD